MAETSPAQSTQAEAATVIEFSPQPKQTVALASPADIVIFGGARGGGKSYALLLAALRHVQNPQFAGVMFRRTYPEVHQEGGLWTTSERIYPFAGGVGSVGNAMWTFPSGSSISMNHMANPMDWQNWLGSQLPFIGFDQLETFTEKQFWTMLACNRDPNGVCDPYIFATCNPEPGWLADFIKWWWDEDTGYPIMERSGQTRWFVRLNNTLHWSDSKDDLQAENPGIPPKSVCFIASFVEDNPALLGADPSYKANLLAQGVVERERWHKGNWKIQATAGTIFNRAWWAGKIVTEVPLGYQTAVRFWDMAATPASEKKDPDWTAGVRMVEVAGNYYISDVRHFRKTPHDNECEVLLSAQLDGIDTAVRMEQEGGSSGKSIVDHYQRNVLIGYNFGGISVNKKKIIRWGPLSSAIQAGKVFLLKGDWNGEFIDELDQCRGEDEKNDQADAASGAFNALQNLGGSASVVDHTRGAERFGGQRYDRRKMF